ncbi:MAG: amidohydrolase family protein [Desulfomonilaceae bacterium]
MEDLVLDGHVHCGMTVPFEEIASEWEAGGIHGGALFSPVEEIYDRYDPGFVDSLQYRTSRTRVHKYLLEIAQRENIFPYFFVWNDFSPIPDTFVGIKWHRHPDEPPYAYETDQCRRIIGDICARRLPVVLEEEFHHTVRFIKEIEDRTVVIIPHMGALNGGYAKLKMAGVFESEKVWVDTALAGVHEIRDFAETYGVERIIFGSDYPFGIPGNEKRKIVRSFSGIDLRAILSGNLLRLLGRAPRGVLAD